MLRIKNKIKATAVFSSKLTIERIPYFSIEIVGAELDSGNLTVPFVITPQTANYDKLELWVNGAKVAEQANDSDFVKTGIVGAADVQIKAYKDGELIQQSAVYQLPIPNAADFDDFSFYGSKLIDVIAECSDPQGLNIEIKYLGVPTNGQVSLIDTDFISVQEVDRNNPTLIPYVIENTSGVTDNGLITLHWEDIALAITSPTAAQEIPNDEDITVAFTVTPAQQNYISAIALVVDGNEIEKRSPYSTTDFTITAGELSDGNHSILLRAYDLNDEVVGSTSVVPFTVALKAELKILSINNGNPIYENTTIDVEWEMLNVPNDLSSSVGVFITQVGDYSGDGDYPAYYALETKGTPPIIGTTTIDLDYWNILPGDFDIVVGRILPGYKTEGGAVQTIEVLPYSYKYLLDEYPGAILARDFFKLSSTYNGNCIRVFRASDSQEFEVGFATDYIGKPYLDVNYLLSLYNGSAIYGVRTYDQSGNGNDLYAPAEVNMPMIVDSNGNLVSEGLFAMLVFDGVDDFLQTAVGLNFGSDSRSIFAVQKADSIGADPTIIRLSEGRSHGNTWIVTPEVAVRTNFITWVSSTPVSTTNLSLISNIYTSGLLHEGNSMWIDGNSVARTSGNNGSINTANSPASEGATTDTSFPFDGKKSTVIIYKSDQTANRAAIENIIMTNYGMV